MTNDYTRDLINKFMAVEAVKAENQYQYQHQLRCYVPLPTVMHVQPQQQRLDAEKIEAVEENYELSLGLSTNGRFGVDPNARKIKRALSIPESAMIPAAADGSGAVGAGAGNLMRTCSLPVVRKTESREEWLRRKEVQSQRRLEARRRKNEKRRHSRTPRERSSPSQERGAGTEAGGENSNNNNPVEQSAGAGADGLIRSTSLVRRVGGMVLNKEIDQVVPISPPTSGGMSGGSTGGGGGSSGTSEETQPRQGTTPMNTENSNSRNIVRPQNNTQLGNFPEGSSSNKIVGPQNKKTVTFLEGSSSSSNRIVGFQNKPRVVRNPLDEMPSVSTKGTNGKKIEGFLYKYGKGRKSVKIVCVCHGSFLTPAEFVRHAGGGDVPNPLQLITVTSRAS